MSKRVLWALAIGVVATLPFTTSSCKKDEPETPNNFTGQYGYQDPNQQGYGQQGYGQPGYQDPNQPGYTQPTQPGYTDPNQPQQGQPAATDPFSQLTGMAGAMLGALGGAATGTDGSTASATDPISIGIQQNAGQNAPGMRPDGSAVRLQLQQGQTSEGQITLQPNKCYTLVGASMLGVLEVEIKVTMPAPLNTQVLGQNAAGMNPMPVVWPGENCYRTPTPIAMPARLEVTMKSGAGTIGIQPYSK